MIFGFDAIFYKNKFLNISERNWNQRKNTENQYNTIDALRLIYTL